MTVSSSPISKFFVSFFMSAALLFGLAAAKAGHHASDEAPMAKQSKNIVETAVSAGSFNTLVAALQATGLDSALADADGSFTVFAPTDEAFAALGQDTIDALLKDKEKLSAILLYHVVGQERSATELTMKAGKSITTLAGGDLSISKSGMNLNVNKSTVGAADIRASNGVIHVIDAVLLPPSK